MVCLPPFMPHAWLSVTKRYLTPLRCLLSAQMKYSCQFLRGYDPDRGRASTRVVLLIADFLHPLHILAVHSAGDGQMAHGGCRRGAMPVLDTGRAPHHVAGAALLDTVILRARRCTARR